MKFILLLFIVWPASSSVTKVGEYDTREACLVEAKKLESIVAELALKRLERGGPLIAPDIRASCDIQAPAPK